MHAAHELTPTDGWNLPTAHSEQSAAPAVLYLPALQFVVHVPSALPNSPAAQSLHAAAPTPLCCPCGHVVQLASAAPLYLLLGHCVQFI